MGEVRGDWLGVVIVEDGAINDVISITGVVGPLLARGIGSGDCGAEPSLVNGCDWETGLQCWGVGCVKA
jgi:hypothetical protein